MEETTFRTSIRRASEPRKHKVTNSLGVYDAYKWYRKNKPNEKKYVLSESQYFAIIRRVNEALREELILTGDLMLPFRMGRLEIRKYPAIITTEGKKIKTNLPIDWDTTLKLWYEDKESYENKTLVHMNVPEIFKVHYNKGKANYDNKAFYQFSTNRELKRLLKSTIKNNANFDAFVNKY